jgi:hypothetical protein
MPWLCFVLLLPTEPGDLSAVAAGPIKRAADVGITEVLSPLQEMDKWIRRRLRCCAWKQRGSRGYRELRQRGVSVREAWNA